MIELLLFIQSIFWLAHPHYVSTSEVNYNPDEDIFEISISLTSHDFEDALKKQFKSTVDLGPKGDSATMNEMVEHYVERFFQVRLDGNNFGLDYQGYELDKDKVNVYLQSEVISFMPVDIHIENRLLFEEFAEQQNIVRFEYNQLKKSARLTRSQPIMHIHLESVNQK
ncbi:MAG: DUF6702 family protein [Saprospiraceae bacterium]